MYPTLTLNFEAVTDYLNVRNFSFLSFSGPLLLDCMFIRKMLESDWLDYGTWTILASIHFRIDGPDHLYGFRSKLKHRIFGKMVEKLSTKVVKSLLRSENCR